MRCRTRRVVPVMLACGVLFSGVAQVKAADPEIDRLLQSPVGKDWVTNGGNLTNQRYSTLKQIDTGNVKQLKGAWMTRLKGSGFGGKYSFEATPLVKDGVMYIVTIRGRMVFLHFPAGAQPVRSTSRIASNPAEQSHSAGLNYARLARFFIRR